MCTPTRGKLTPLHCGLQKCNPKTLETFTTTLSNTTYAGYKNVTRKEVGITNYLSSVTGALMVETPQSVPTAPSMHRHTMRAVLVIDQFCVVRTKKFLHQKDRVKVRVGVSMLQFYTIQSYPVHLRWILGRNMG